MSLQIQLRQFHQEFLAKSPPATLAILETAAAELRERFAQRPSLRPGDLAPDFMLVSAEGTLVSLSEQVEKGPLILSFFRGGWCPYCLLELRAYQGIWPEIQALGAFLLAVSPQTLTISRAMAERNGLGYPLLSDLGCQTAQDYGLAFVVPDAVRALYYAWGHPLPDYNGSEDWLLPIPATFILDRRRRIVEAFIEPDFSRRYEPETALARLRTLV
ncbi:MAG: redoxin domain-containing protein [Cyanobacteria bacterium RI_101]|nr:redoxin domain-containing protein [Cyanobacteria bacterium RI_101]